MCSRPSSGTCRKHPTGQTWSEPKLLRTVDVPVKRTDQSICFVKFDKDCDSFGAAGLTVRAVSDRPFLQGIGAFLGCEFKNMVSCCICWECTNSSKLRSHSA